MTLCEELKCTIRDTLFKKGKIPIDDKTRSGRPSTSTKMSRNFIQF